MLYHHEHHNFSIFLINIISNFTNNTKFLHHYSRTNVSLAAPYKELQGGRETVKHNTIKPMLEALQNYYKFFISNPNTGDCE